MLNRIIPASGVSGRSSEVPIGMIILWSESITTLFPAPGCKTISLVEFDAITFVLKSNPSIRITPLPLATSSKSELVNVVLI